MYSVPQVSADPITYEYLIVGAGSAGCVVAGRLAEAGRRTLLLEAGEADPYLVHGKTGLLVPDQHRSRYWPPAIEQGGSDGADRTNRTDYWMGRGLGGGSAVNGMLLSPGDQLDYDRWAAVGGCPSWSFDAMDPWLTKATDALRPEIPAPMAGADPAVRAFDEAFGQLGLVAAGSTLDADRPGLFRPGLSTRNGVRRSLADAYLTPALGSGDSTLAVRTGAEVAALLVEHRSVHGVALTDGSTIMAGTVIVAAGTVGSARLVRRTNLVPEAGGWLRNHQAVALSFPWPDVRASRDREPTVHRVARWFSPMSGEQPDLSAILMGPFAAAGEESTGIVLVMAAAARSSGRLHPDSDPPVLLSNRLSDPDDAVRLRHGARTAGVVVEQLWDCGAGSSGSRPRAGVDRSPRLRSMSDARLDRWIRRHPGPVYHAVGSCRMGRPGSPGAVTDETPGRAGTIPGLAGVVLADASIFPDLVSGGLQLPVAAVAERVVAETLLS